MRKPLKNSKGARGTVELPAEPEATTWTPAKVAGIIPEDRRRLAIYQAKELRQHLTEAIDALENFAQDPDGLLERIERAWVAWRLGEQPTKAERIELLRKIGVLAARVPVDLSPEGCALMLLGSPGVERALGGDAQRAMAVREQLICLLKVWGKRTRHGPGQGKWHLASDLVFAIWRERIAPASLRVELQQAATP